MEHRYVYSRQEWWGYHNFTLHGCMNWSSIWLRFIPLSPRSVLFLIWIAPTFIHCFPARAAIKVRKHQSLKQISLELKERSLVNTWFYFNMKVSYTISIILYQFFQATITEYHRLGDLITTFIFSHFCRLKVLRSSYQQGWFLLRPFLAYGWSFPCDFKQCSLCMHPYFLFL